MQRWKRTQGGFGVQIFVWDLGLEFGCGLVFRAWQVGVGEACIQPETSTDALNPKP